MNQPIALNELNALPIFDFLAALEPVYGNASWVTALAFAQRPFLNLDHLHRALAEIVASADLLAKVDLIQLQPDFMKSTSALPGAERAALKHVPDEEYKGLHKLQIDYVKKFGFPLVVCLTAQLETMKKTGLLSALTPRLANTRDQEVTNSVDEMLRVYRLRLEQWVVG